MKYLYWIAGVAVLAGIVFFLFGMSGSIWASVTGAMGVVGLFFIGLLAYVIRNARSSGDLVLGIGVLVLFAALAVRVGLSSYHQARWQRKQLMKVRATVDQGHLTIHLNIPLLKTLKARYQEQTGTKDLRQLFMQRYGGHLKPDGSLTRYIPEDRQKDEVPYFYYDSTQTENKVVLVGRSKFGNGEDPEFTNYGGGKGNLQYKSVLTPKGVDYVKEN